MTSQWPMHRLFGVGALCVAISACLVEIHDLVPVPDGGGGDGGEGGEADGGGAFGGGGSSEGGGGGAPARGAYWSLDEGAGQVATDDVGYDNRIVLGDTSGDESADGIEPAWETDPAVVCKGSALDFAGGDAVATVESNDNLVDFRRFSASFCIHPRSLVVGAYGRILSKEYTEQDGIYITATEAGELNAAHYDSDGMNYQASSSAGEIEVGVTSCWTVTFDDEGDRRFYIYKAGVDVTVASEPLPEGTTIGGSASAWRIGNNGAKSRGFDGVIDEVYLDDAIVDTTTMEARAACR
ncbi:MAG: hypothetical protein HOW73_48355 [Polyangiaceae bacterium]|nr:hypothetical protein [Polyangiaceae bacterium]